MRKSEIKKNYDYEENQEMTGTIWAIRKIMKTLDCEENLNL